MSGLRFDIGLRPSPSEQADSGFSSGSTPSSAGSYTATNGRKVHRRWISRRSRVSIRTRAFSSNDQSNTNSCEINAESGHGIERTDDAMSNLQTGNIEAEIAGRKGNNTGEVFAQFIKQEKEAREANQESHIKQEKEAREENQEAGTTSSLVVISRILKGIPQNPHFYQLRNHSELARKSMVCAWDQIFSETAEQIHCIQANGFWVRARELWRTMEELQTVGYNVVPLRRRLVDLSDVMMEMNVFKSNIKGLKIKAENHRAEKSRLEFVILRMQEMIKREQEGMDRVVAQVMDMEKEFPKFDEAFANLALELF